MFIQLHGVLGNERILLNVYEIEGFQEIKKGSKYYENYGEKGAKTVVRVRGLSLPVKETIVQITHALKRVQLIGGAAYEGQNT